MAAYNAARGNVACHMELHFASTALIWLCTQPHTQPESDELPLLPIQDRSCGNFVDLSFARWRRGDIAYCVLLRGSPMTMQRRWTAWVLNAVREDLADHPRYQSLEAEMGYSREWSIEHRKRAMSLAPITGIPVDPRDALED